MDSGSGQQSKYRFVRELWGGGVFSVSVGQWGVGSDFDTENLAKFEEARVLPAVARRNYSVPPPCSLRRAVFWSVSGWYTN